MANATGEAKPGPLRLQFDRFVRLHNGRRSNKRRNDGCHYAAGLTDDSPGRQLIWLRRPPKTILVSCSGSTFPGQHHNFSSLSRNHPRPSVERCGPLG
jgi:hypothetical protein